LNSLAQLSTNIGWLFLISWLPTFLTESKQVDPLQGAVMVSIVLAVGVPGQSSGFGQALVFLACGTAFFVSALSMLGMDAIRPVERAIGKANLVDPG
jgi:hypothetical protein